MGQYINWGELQDAADEGGGFEPIPQGSYLVHVDSAEAKKSSNGKDMISVTFKVDEGPYQGRNVFNQFVISPENNNALGFFFRHMAALGLTREYFATHPQLDVVARDLINRVCQISVAVDDKYDGTPRNKVKSVSPPPLGTTGTYQGSPAPSSVPVPGGPGIPTPPTPTTAPAPVPSYTPPPTSPF